MSFRKFEDLDEGKKSLLNQDYDSLSDENFKEYLKKDLCILFNPDLFIKKWNDGNKEEQIEKRKDLLIGYDYYLRNMKQENPPTSNFNENLHGNDAIEIKPEKKSFISKITNVFKKTGGRKKKSQKRKKTKRVRKSKKNKKSTRRRR